MEAKRPVNEDKRLGNLVHYNILDTLPEDAWDNITALASLICDMPISAISLIDKNRQWFKSTVGFDISETPREIAFCAHTILENDVIIVNNTLKDERFKDNPLVTGDTHVRFYAGTQIVSPEGFYLGALCVIDQRPNRLSAEQVLSLKYLGQQVTSLLDLHKKNQELEKALDDAKEANSAKDQFLSLISHEIRSPLNAILGFNELILTEAQEQSATDFTQEITEYATHSQKSGSKLLKLVDNVLHLIQTQATKLDIQKEKMALKPFISELIKAHQPLVLANRNVLTAEISAIDVTTDPQFLHHILSNLIANACKFTQDGKIEIQTRTDSNYVYMTVSDTGIGLKESDVPHIFNPFFKVDKSNTIQGTGLGLSLCKTIASQLGGRIQVESQWGSGTQFTLVLPI